MDGTRVKMTSEKLGLIEEFPSQATPLVPVQPFSL